MNSCKGDYINSSRIGQWLLIRIVPGHLHYLRHCTSLNEFLRSMHGMGAIRFMCCLWASYREVAGYAMTAGIDQPLVSPNVALLDDLIEVAMGHRSPTA